MGIRTSWRAVVQVVAFRNIDVCTAGVYRVEIGVTSEDQRSRDLIKASASNLTKSSFFRSFLPSNITANAYISAPFQISYSDEVIPIGDIVDFEIDIETTANIKSNSATLEVILAYCEGGNKDQSAAMAAAAAEYVEVGKGRVEIREPCKGVHEYVEVGIEDNGRAAVGLVVHAECVNWEYQPEWKAEAGGEDVPTPLGEFLFPGFASRYPTEAHIAEVYTDYLTPLLSKSTLLSSLLRPESPGLVPLQAQDKGYTCDEFREIFGQGEAELIATVILEEMQKAGQRLREVMDGVRAGMGEEETEFYREKYEQKTLISHSSAVISSPQLVDSVPLATTLDLSPKGLKPIFLSHRSQPAVPLPSLCPVLANPSSLGPLLYHESFSSPNQASSSDSAASTGIHLYVFVPGYGSTNADLRPVKNVFAWYFHSNSQYLVSTCNDGHTDSDLLTLGQALATEVQTHISIYCKGSIRRISFIGHSLGGLIVRAALRWLREFRGKLGVFVSLSCPHLGLMYGKSKWVKAGTWVIESFKRSVCIKQLKMKDQPDLRATALYDLSGDECFSQFKFVLLFSSHQDKMVPLESARMELCERAQDGSDRGFVFLDMLSRLLTPFPPFKLHRILVDFPKSESGFGQIGRKAHIEFITNRLFMEILCTQFHDLLV